MLTGSITEAGPAAADLEAAGYSGAWTVEGPHDPFLPLAVGAASTREMEAMASLIDDEILDSFAVAAAPEEIAPELARRYGDVISRISFYAPYRGDPDRWQAVMAAIKAI